MGHELWQPQHNVQHEHLGLRRTRRRVYLLTRVRHCGFVSVSLYSPWIKHVGDHYGHGNPDPNADADAYCNPDSYPYTHGHTYSDTDAGSNAYAFLNTPFDIPDHRNRCEHPDQHR